MYKYVNKDNILNQNVINLKKYKLEYPEEPPSIDKNSLLIVKDYNLNNNKYILEWNTILYDTYLDTQKLKEEVVFKDEVVKNKLLEIEDNYIKKISSIEENYKNIILDMEENFKKINIEMLRYKDITLANEDNNKNKINNLETEIQQLKGEINELKNTLLINEENNKKKTSELESYY